MFCKKCGATLKDGAKFCSKCGTPVTAQEQSDDSQAELKPTVILPDVNKKPEYKKPENGGRGTKVLAIIALVFVIAAILGILGFIFLPKIKDSAPENSYEGIYKKAQTAYEEGEFEAAIGYYRKLIDQDPEAAEPYIQIAKAFDELGKPQKAIDILVDGYEATGYDFDKEGTSGDKDILKLLVEYLEKEGKTLEDVNIVVEDSNLTGDSSEGEESLEKYTGEKTDINIDVRQVDNSNFPNVTVYVSVTDTNGNVVEDLKKTDFDITEIDKNGNVSGASIDDVYRILGEDRINVNLVLDKSGSMGGGKMGQAQNAANALVDYMSLDSGDRIEVISFDNYVYLEQDFTSRKEMLATAIDGISPGGQTALYDALYAGVYQTYYENGAKCVIAFTDGAENASSYSFEDVVEIARNTSIPVYIIGIGDTSYDSTPLRDLATQCSGRYYSANDSDLQSILEDIYIGIYQEQQDYYVFKYTASNTENMGEFRDLVIDTSETTQYRGHYVKSYVPVSDINGAFSKEYMNKDNILDFSSTREVTNSDLANLSLAELRIARNEIFARHGRQFKDPLLNQWFYSKNWYLSIPYKYAPDEFDKNNPDPLSAIEQKNTNFILSYEKNVMASEDIFPNASTEVLSDYDLALSKPVLKTALAQMNRYPSSPTLEENKKVVQEAIDNPDVTY